MRFLIFLLITGCATSNSSDPVLPPTANLNEELTCNYGLWDTIPTSNYINVSGTGFTAQVGVSQQFGGIVTELGLNGVNLLDTRSGAGASWQWTSIVTDFNNTAYISNQASGNTAGFQWGESNNVWTSKNEIGVNNWNSLSPDSVTQNGNNSGRSPCSTSDSGSDRGAPYIQVNTAYTPHGKVLEVDNTYTYLAQKNQSWADLKVFNSIYFPRSVARQHSLTVSVPGNSKVIPYDYFKINNLACVSSFGGTTGSFCTFTQNYPYLGLSWTVNSQVFSIVILNITKDSVLGLEDSMYCPDTSNDDCGSIFFFNKVWEANNLQYSAGAERTFMVKYFIGTVSQLGDLGFSI